VRYTIRTSRNILAEDRPAPERERSLKERYRVPKPNYQFEKRKKDLQKKKKQDEKRQRKAEKITTQVHEDGTPISPGEEAPVDGGVDGGGETPS
jgi:hypothetical protein